MTPTRPPRLELSGLSRRFGATEVVKGLSLQVAAGQVTCLLGPSGCGKSTTLRMIAGVETQDAGRILLDGTEIAGPTVTTPPEARSVGLMFQDFALFPHLSVCENVAFGLKGGVRRNRDRVAHLLARVNMSGFSEAYPHQLSGGEQQRVALARALAPSPGVMLMDEPFSGLDNRLRDAIRDDTLSVLKDEGTAVLLVTHEPDEAMRMADTIALMRNGEIVQQGTPYAMYNTPVDRQAAAFFSDVNVISGSVSDALCQTPFGPFLTPGHADGAELDILIRPQHITIDFDRAGEGPKATQLNGLPARGTVRRARFMGRETLVDFVMDHDGSILTATVPAVFLPSEGKAFWLSVRRDRCFVYPRT